MQKRLPGSSFVPGSFMTVSVAMGYHKNHPFEAAYLSQFIAAAKHSGFLLQAIDRAGMDGAAVPPG
jgi:polar amino acid transport system substrate-binding protein